MSGALGAAAGFLLDRLLGEPPAAVHPVAWYGRAMSAAERRMWSDDRVRGVMFTGMGVLPAVGAGLTLRAILGAGPSTTLVATLSIAGRMLNHSAIDVSNALDNGDLDGARALLPTLVGRDPSRLDHSNIARAAIESVAENTVDAVIAPLWWGAVAGAPGILAHRAINTLDAMVGHRSQRYRRFGWASARLDDLANWWPARLGVVAVMLASPRRWATVRSTVRGDAGRHPSPNAGPIEAAYAAALDVGLGGSNVYGGVTETRGRLGDGAAPTAIDIRRAVSLATRSSELVAASIAAVGVLGHRHAARRPTR